MHCLVRITAAAAVAGALIGGSASSQSSAAAAASLPRCQNIQLSITPDRSNGSAGHIGILYRLHNSRPSSCSLIGYPGVQLLDRSFRTLPTHLQWGGVVLDGRRTPSMVTLQAGGNAWFALVYRDVELPDGSCSTASYLMVFPPNDRLPVVSYAGQRGATVRACGGELRASPVTLNHRGF